MAFDFGKLRGRIVEKFGSQAAFARAFGVSRNTFSKKMNNKTRFTSGDIVKIAEMLEISDSEVGAYFFTKKV